MPDSTDDQTPPAPVPSESIVRLGQALAGLSDEDRELLARFDIATGLVAEEHHHSGPLPTPGDFAAYGKALANAPDRILAMAEAEQRSRHAAQGKALNAELLRTVGALLLALRGLGVALAAALNGYAGTAITIGLAGPVLGLARFYLAHRNRRR